MSRTKGNQASGWVARFLRPWWPHAEKTPNGRQGEDIENTPGVSFEVKTSPVWRSSALTQAARNGRGSLPVVVYLPPGIGEKQVELGYAIMPLSRFMDLLVDAGYAPAPREGELCSG